MRAMRERGVWGLFDSTLVVVVTLLLAIVVPLRPVSATPIVYYASLGDTAQLQCGSGGSLVCYSTYADKTIPFAMVALTPSYKYQIQSGYVAISNVQATDAGFYTCAARCDQVTYEQISYYLHPTSKREITIY